MELLTKNIRSLSFWKRSPESVEAIQRLSILRDGKTFQVEISLGKKTSCTLNEEEFQTLLNVLEKEYHVLDTPEEYKAFKYEDDIENFNLKFFLEIQYQDFTYLAIKGLHPFKQPYYQEIMALFNKFFY
jgi:hypothetical protein